MISFKFSRFLKPFATQKLFHKNFNTSKKHKVVTIVNYIAGTSIIMLGVSYSAVPLYRIFCQAVGLGGSSELAKVKNIDIIKYMKPIRDREITVTFDCDKDVDLKWNFRPLQKEIKVVPGETALAFYRASNPTDEPLIGISTYNVIPVEAGKYFHKIQCFCFEEQRLNPKEEVDMPILFFLDPEYDEDYSLIHIDEVLLSYTFFKAKESLILPLPDFLIAK